MARSWAENDLLSMGEWLNGLPDSPTTDRGVKAYAERLMDQAPASALDSAMGITNDGIRNKTVQELSQEWYSEDPDAAVSWANNNSYPPEAMERTLENYAELTADQLQQISKEINRDQVAPEQMVALKEKQALLQEQAAQLKQALPDTEGVSDGG